MEDDARQFIQSLEERYGGPVGFRTYSTWFASNHGVVREFGVFLYKINDVFHFEDFERKPTLFGFPMRSSKNKEPYIKMEGSFLASDVASITMVTKSKALACAEGQINQDAIAPASPVAKLFKSLVSRVVLHDGTTYFFELINNKQFNQAVQEDTDGSVQSL